MPEAKRTFGGYHEPADYPEPSPPLSEDDLSEGFAPPKLANQMVFNGGMSDSKFNQLIGLGRIASKRVGRQRMIPLARLRRDVAEGRLSGPKESES
jgi:hypothetical protein